MDNQNQFNQPQHRGLRLYALGLCLIAAITAATFVIRSIQLTEAQAASAKGKGSKRTKRRVEKKEVSPSTESLGALEADLTVRAEKEKPFAIDIWLVPKDKKFNGTVTVFMEQTAQMKYEPRVFQIRPGERRTIEATVLRTSCGIAPVEATAENWEGLNTIVDTGFTAKLKTNIAEAIDSGDTKSFSINLVDNQGNPVQLDTDVDLTLQGSKIKLKTPEDTNWHDRIVIPIRENSSSSQALNIQSDSMVADKGLISANLESNGFVIHDEDLWIDVKARWYVPLLMAILGGLVHSIYKIIKESNDPRQPLSSWRFFFRVVLGGLLAGVLAGGLAYLLASWGVLGIKVDTTTLQGFVILGFLFSYVGVDLILKAITNKDARADPPLQASPRG